MDMWQSEVKRTCTAECRQRIDGSRDRVLQQRCSSVHDKEQRSEPDDVQLADVERSVATAMYCVRPVTKERS